MSMKFLLSCLCISVFISLTIYIFQTRQYPQWDEHHYLSIAVKTLDAINSKGIIGIGDSISIGGNRQPFYSIILSLVLLILGTSHTYKVALGINAILFCFTIVGTYLLAKEFLRPFPSLFAAFLYGTFGNSLFYAHFTYVETAATTMIIWAVLFLKKTDSFRSTPHTLLATLFFILATLTRFVAPIFLLGPILVVVGKTIWEICNGSKDAITVRKITHSKQQSPPESRKRSGNMFLFVLLSILVPLVVYFIPNRLAFLTYVKDNQTYGAQWVATYRDPVMANTFSLRSMTYYFNIIEQNTIGIFLVFAIGMILILGNIVQSIIKKNVRALFSYFFILFSFIFPYLFFTFIAVWKEDRFIVPIYPIVAIISAFAIEKILHMKRIGITVITIITFISFLNAAGSLFGYGPMGQRGLVDYVTPRWLPHPRRMYLTPLVWPPTKEYSNAALFMNAIESDWKNPTKARVLISFQHEPFINAVTSIVTYEKRSLATLTVDSVASTSPQFDYVALQKELPDQKYMQKINIPYDSSTVYLYKKP